MTKQMYRKVMSDLTTLLYDTTNAFTEEHCSTVGDYEKGEIVWDAAMGLMMGAYMEYWPGAEEKDFTKWLRHVVDAIDEGIIEKAEDFEARIKRDQN